MKNNSKIPLPWIAFIFFMAAWSGSEPVYSCETVPSSFHAVLEKRAGDSAQVLIVSSNRPESFTARTYAFEKKNGSWRLVLTPAPSVIGAKGFAPPGMKKEGDGKTPSGIFPLGAAFGYEKSVATQMPYRQAAQDDVWVDDARSGDYNRWVKKGETKAASFERMLRDDNLYKYGVVIEYNTNPVISGRGSAIFFHVWKSGEEPTSGCVAMSESDILKILRWLNPAAKPLVIMGTVQTIMEIGR
ncbi:MAG: L,D-transpeptidase [Syntrophales bacterium]